MLKRLLKTVAWILGILAAIPVIMNLAVIGVASFFIRSAQTVPETPVILVLGAGVWANSKLSPMLQDRVDQGIALYESGKGAKLLMSGDHSSPYYDEVSTMKRYAVDKGVASSDVFLDHSRFSTYESLLRARDIFGARKMIIVTQRYHLYRAVFIARALGIEAYGVPSDARAYNGEVKRQIREFFARAKDFVQVWLPAPEFNEQVDLTGDGDETNTP
mgnify:CR=1 FL=1